MPDSKDHGTGACVESPETLICEEWLKTVGFKWHEFDRQNTKHWLLWLGDAVRGSGMTSFEDIGIELAPVSGGVDWFCWLRSDTSHRYCRFIHIRHIRTRRDLEAMIYGLTGLEFIPENCFYGSMLTQEHADWHRKQDQERADRVLLRTGHPWADIERDDTRGGALPEHMQVAEDARNGKR